MPKIFGHWSPQARSRKTIGSAEKYRMLIPIDACRKFTAAPGISFHLLKKTALLNTMILTKEEKQNFITQQALAILKDPDNYKPCSFTEENCYKFKNNQMVFQEINLLKSTKLVKPKISFKNNNNFEVDPQLLKKITDNQLTPQPFIKAYYIKKTDITIDNIPEGLIAKKDFKKLFSLSIL